MSNSEPGQGTTFTLHLPVTLSVIRAALAEIGGELYAFPLAQLVRVLRCRLTRSQPVQGRQQIHPGRSVGRAGQRGRDPRRTARAGRRSEGVSVMVVGQDGEWCGLVVDRFVGEQDIVVRPLDPRLGKVPHISAAAVTETGDPLLIVDVEDLLQSMQQLLGEGRLRGNDARSVPQGRPQADARVWSWMTRSRSAKSNGSCWSITATTSTWRSTGRTVGMRSARPPTIC